MTFLILAAIMSLNADHADHTNHLMTQVALLEQSLGAHLCPKEAKGDPEHQHALDSLRAARAGATMVTFAPCYLERSGDVLHYRYRVVVVKLHEVTVQHGGKWHVTIQQGKELR